MGYCFVDRILEVRAGEGGAPRGGRGVLLVSQSCPFLRRGPGGELELSPCFAAEAVGQLAAWVAMSGGGFARRPVAGLTAEVEIHRAARVGELLVLDVEIESLEDDALHYHGEASAGGQPIVRLRDSVGPLLPMERFDDPSAVEREFRAVLRPGGEDATGAEAGVPAPSGIGSGEPARIVDHPAIDAVVEREEDRLLAVTCVSRSAPYLVDHFPRDPVLPASLLFDAQVAMALELATGREARGGRPPAWRPRPARLTDLKMRDFVRPGTRVLSEARVRERRPGRVLVQLLGRVGGRTVSSGLLEMVGEQA